MVESSILAQFRVNWRGINKKSPIIAGAARLSGSKPNTNTRQGEREGEREKHI